MKREKIVQLARKNVLTMKPYSSARDEYSGQTGIFLDANENSLGSVLPQPLNRYPDPHQRELKGRLSEIKNVAPDRIFLGNGSDEAIDLVIRVFCEPGLDRIMILPPTYGMYAVCAEMNDAGIIEAPLTAQFEIDTEAVLKRIDEVKVVFICSPNNPSGNCINRRVIRTILEKSDGLVVIDEAYIDFSEQPSWLEKLGDYPNLIVLQTFSKAWGLANIRLGMAFADPQIIALFNKIKYPYNVNGVTQKMALEALGREDSKNSMVAVILEERVKLARRLAELAIVEKVFPSEANFLLARFRNGRRVFDYLKTKELIVRDRSRVMHCAGCLRITVGTPSENAELMQMLHAYKGDE